MVIAILIGGVLVAWGAIYAWRRRTPQLRMKREAEAQRRKWNSERERKSNEKRANLREGEKARHRKNAAKQQLAAGDRKIDALISEIGDKSSGVLACPRCGGNQFKTKRSGAVKGAAVVGTLALGPLGLAALAKASEVKCVTCGTSYKRG